jgi:hypothetical protein
MSLQKSDLSYLVFLHSPERGLGRAVFFPHNMPREETFYVHQVDEYSDGGRRAREVQVDPHQWYGADWIRWVWGYFARPDEGRTPPEWQRCDPPQWAEEWFRCNPPENEVSSKASSEVSSEVSYALSC